MNAPSSAPPDTETNFTPAAPAVREWFGVLVLLALLFGLDLLTYNISPTVWCDDISFTEPAINFVLRGSYTSAVWPFQPLNTFPAVNCPLYTQSIAGWLALFGTDLFAVRSYNYFLMTVSCLLFWLLLHRLKLLPSARWRLAFVTVFHLGYGISFAYRCSRPDTLGLCLTLVLGLLFAARPAPARNFWLLAVSVVLPWVSLTGGLYAGLACFCAVLVLGRSRFFEAVVVWAGLAVGVLSLVWFLVSQNALQNFIAGANSAVGDHYFLASKASILTRIGWLSAITLPEYFKEYSSTILWMGSLVLLVLCRRELKANANWRVIIGSALLLVATPLVFNLTGHYAFYYSYTIFTPALILFAAAAFPASRPELRPQTAGILPTMVIFTTIVATALVGLPLRTAINLALTKIVPRAEIQRHVAMVVTTNDVVFTDDTAFFEVKPLAKVVYNRWSFIDFICTPFPGRHMTQADKDSLNKIVVRADQSNFFIKFFGGQWRAVTEPFGDITRWDLIERLPLVQKKVKTYLEQPQTFRYRLQVFERVSPAASGSSREASQARSTQNQSKPSGS